MFEFIHRSENCLQIYVNRTNTKDLTVEIDWF